MSYGGGTAVVRSESTAGVLDRWDGLVPRLSAFELARAGRFRQESDRRDYLAAHVLVREVVAEFLGGDVSSVVVTQVCETCGGRDHGPPSVSVPGAPTVYASWSHTHGAVVAGAASSPVGVDMEGVERMRAMRDVPTMFLAPAEESLVRGSPDVDAALAHLWTMKEALVKVGALQLDQFSSVDLSPRPHAFGPWRLSTRRDDDLDTVVSVAVAGGDPGDSPVDCRFCALASSATQELPLLRRRP